MKTVSNWRRIARIGLRINLQTGKHIPLRGFSPLEIARYLMSKQRKHLTSEDIQILQKIIEEAMVSTTHG